jgi:hypothetical protein
MGQRANTRCRECVFSGIGTCPYLEDMWNLPFIQKIRWATGENLLNE